MVKLQPFLFEKANNLLAYLENVCPDLSADPPKTEFLLRMFRFTLSDKIHLVTYIKSKYVEKGNDFNLEEATQEMIVGLALDNERARAHESFIETIQAYIQMFYDLGSKLE